MEIELSINNETRIFDCELTPGAKVDESVEQLRKSGKFVYNYKGRHGTYTLSKLPRLIDKDSITFLHQILDRNKTIKLKYINTWYDVVYDGGSFDPSFVVDGYGEVKSLKFKTLTYIDDIDHGGDPTSTEVPDELVITSIGEVPESGETVQLNFETRRNGSAFAVTQPTRISINKLMGECTFTNTSFELAVGESTYTLNATFTYNDTGDDKAVILEATQITGDYLPSVRHEINLIGKNSTPTTFYYGESDEINFQNILPQLSSKTITRQTQINAFNCNAQRAFFIYDEIYGIPKVTSTRLGYDLTQDLDIYRIVHNGNNYVAITKRVLQYGVVEWTLDFLDGTLNDPISTSIHTHYDPKNPEDRPV